MKYLLDKESIEKLAIEVFGEERCWVRETYIESGILNPDFDYNEYRKDPENYQEAEYIMDSIPVIEVYTHFPEITITNSKGHAHRINDLFTRFSISDINEEKDYKCNVIFEGMRTTYSFREVYSGYGHSHLNNAFEFDAFCTGSSFYNTLIHSDIRISPTEETWLMLFMGLENFVSWESLEGGPYHRMGDIHGPEENVSFTELKLELRVLLPLLPKSVWTYTEGLKLIENHPALYQVFNEYSSIRKFSRADKTYIEEKIKEWKIKYWCKIIWKEDTKDEKTFPLVINHELNQDNPQISKEVVDGYIQIINKQVQHYNQNLSYEQAKELWYPKTVAKAGIIQ